MWCPRMVTLCHHTLSLVRCIILEAVSTLHLSVWSTYKATCLHSAPAPMRMTGAELYAKATELITCLGARFYRGVALGGLERGIGGFINIALWLVSHNIF